MGYTPQYCNHDADAGNVVTALKMMAAAEHAPASPLVLDIAVSDGATSKIAQPENGSPPQLVV